MPPVTNATEVTKIANKMLQSAEYSIYHIAEVRTIDPRFWQVKAIAYPLTNVRMRIDGEKRKVVVEFVKEDSRYLHPAFLPQHKEEYYSY